VTALSVSDSRRASAQLEESEQRDIEMSAYKKSDGRKGVEMEHASDLSKTQLNLFRVKFPAACGAFSVDSGDTPLLAVGLFIRREFARLSVMSSALITELWPIARRRSSPVRSRLAAI
jgi:hypothetical protein